jgi:hypothetical protein
MWREPALRQGSPLAKSLLLLWGDETVREKIISKVTNPQTRLFWEAYNRRSPRDRQELVSSTMNKVDSYLHEPMIANIVSQSRTTIDFRQIMDKGKILLVNMPRQYEEISRFVGSMLIGKLLMAAFSRIDVPDNERRQFYLYVDEFQHFCGSEFRNFLEESRKFRCSVTIAHQSLSQLPEEHRIAATGAATMIVFRTLGEESTVFSKSFDATPQPVVVGMEPQRAVVADPISSLVTRGHQDPRVAAFSQRFLAALEHYVKTPSSPSVAYVKTWDASHDCFDGRLSLYDHQVQEGRKLLNECLYRCQSETNPHLYIPMLATYVLALSQRDGREYVFSPHVQAYNHGILFGPFSLKGFEESARKFGEAGFVQPNGAASYIASVAKYRKREKWMAEAVVSMLTELRYVMSVLARSPIMVDTGQMVEKYALRTYSDQQNQNANEISQLENYHAKVKTLGGEYLLKTNPPPPLLPEREIQARIQAIKANNKAEGLTRDYREVLEEIAKRQERLRQRPNDAPPPSHSTGRPIRRRRPTGQG